MRHERALDGLQGLDQSPARRRSQRARLPPLAAAAARPPPVHLPPAPRCHACPQVPEKAKHYGISKLLPEAVDPSKDLVLQYDLKLGNGLSCGGACECRAAAAAHLNLQASRHGVLQPRPAPPADMPLQLTPACTAPHVTPSCHTRVCRPQVCHRRRRLHAHRPQGRHPLHGHVWPRQVRRHQQGAGRRGLGRTGLGSAGPWGLVWHAGCGHARMRPHLPACVYSRATLPIARSHAPCPPRRRRRRCT